MMNTTTQLLEAGQSVWYDNIQRNLLKNGEMAGMIASVKIVSLNELIIISVMPPTITSICERRSARVLVSESCSSDMSDEIRLLSSPTLRDEKNDIGSLIR